MFAKSAARSSPPEWRRSDDRTAGFILSRALKAPRTPDLVARSEYLIYNLVMELGNFETLILLAVLRLEEEDAYGARIRRELLEVADRDASIGAIHATLERLIDKGYVDSRVGEATPKRGGRRKRHYWVSIPGQRALRQALSRIDRLAQGLSALGTT